MLLEWLWDFGKAVILIASIIGSVVLFGWCASLGPIQAVVGLVGIAAAWFATANALWR